MNLIAGCANINAPADGCGWVKPISVAEEDRLTTATKRALLVHNEAWTEFCKLSGWGGCLSQFIRVELPTSRLLHTRKRRCRPDSGFHEMLLHNPDQVCSTPSCF